MRTGSSGGHELPRSPSLSKRGWGELKEKKRIFYLLCLGSLTISFNVTAIAACLPTISRDLRISDVLAARIIPCYMIPYGVGALAAAAIIRYISYRSLLSFSTALYALVSLLCAVTNSFEVLLLARVVMGVAASAVVPLGLILIGKIFPKEMRGRMIGGFFSSSFAASVIGTAISSVAHWRWLFFVPGLIAIGLTVLFRVLSFEILDHRERHRVNYKNIIANSKICRVFAIILILSMLYHAVYKWLGVYLARIYNFEQFKISMLFVAIAVSGALGQMIGGYLTDKKGRLKTCTLGLFMLGMATVLLSGVFPVIVLVIILSGMSMGWTIGHNALSTILTDFPDEHRAEIAGLNSSIRFLSGGIGFSLSSFFIEKSFQMTFLVFGIIMLGLSFLASKIIPCEYA